MSTTPVRVRIVPLESGFLRATSVDHPGLYVAAKNEDDLVREVSKALVELFSLDGSSASIASGPERLDENTFLWKICRAEPARRKLA